MKKYKQYIPTKNLFLGTIPDTWNEVPFRAVCSIKCVQNNANEELLSVFLNRGVVRYSDTAKMQVHKPSEDMSKYQLVEPGDLVFNNQQAWRGSVGVSNYRGIVSPAYIVMSVDVELNSKYVNYMVRESSCVAQLLIASKGVGSIQRILSPVKLMSSYFIIPPREEQDQIVCYLDWQTSKINKLINEKKQIITLLEEQKQAIITHIVTCGLEKNIELIDSGIDYIGKVPSHWKVLLNHRIYKEKSRKFDGEETVLSLSQKDGLLPYKNMKERSLHTASYDNWKLVFPNDLVLNRFKAHLGVFFSSNYRGIVTFHYGVYEPIMKIASKYYEALYHTLEFRRVFASKSNGMTVGLQNLSNTNFYSVYTVYPPYEEQCQIVCKIEEIEEKYQKLISKINQEIDCLHEYKTRLISDVVTGQIDVRGIEIPDFELVEETIDIQTEDEMGIE